MQLGCRADDKQHDLSRNRRSRKEVSGSNRQSVSSAWLAILRQVAQKERGQIYRTISRRCVTNGGSLDDADAPIGLCSLVAKPANFDRQPVTLQGTATAVKKNASSQGNNYTLFKLQDPGGCGAVNIFTWGHPKLSNGDDVRVEGVFETVHHQDRSIFYNQVEATKVIPLPR